MATATYPPPPPYYKLYKEYSQDPVSGPAPPPPIQGPYVLCGGNYTNELRSLNRELRLHFLELADVLVEHPSQHARQVEEIPLIFKNICHLLNSLRSHQARATLFHILQLQTQRRKQAVDAIKRRREVARGLLGEALGSLEGQ